MSPMTFYFAVAVLLLSVSNTKARCSNSDECMTPKDCGDGEVCHPHTCTCIDREGMETRRCGTDRQCPDGYTCEDHLCSSQLNIPETTIPETTIIETTIPETTIIKKPIAETTIVETTIPETTILETTIPEITIPEKNMPETTIPETTVNGSVCGSGTFVLGPGIPDSSNTLNYPSDYTADLDCTWTYTNGDEASAFVHVYFTGAFVVEDAATCDEDSVEIFDGASDSASSLAKYCGTGFPPDVMTTQNSVFLQFLSDSDANVGDGFSFTVDSYTCGGELTISADTQITSPNFSGAYPADARCVWLIQSPDINTALDVEFNSFDMSGSCDDELTFYDGVTFSQRGQLVSLSCGDTANNFDGSTRSLMIVLDTKSSTGDSYTGTPSFDITVKVTAAGRTNKYKNFLMSDFGSDDVTVVPGIGSSYQTNLAGNSITLASELVTQLAAVNFHRDNFLSWYQGVSSASSNFARQTYDSLKEWCDIFLAECYALTN